MFTVSRKPINIQAKPQLKIENIETMTKVIEKSQKKTEEGSSKNTLENFSNNTPLLQEKSVNQIFSNENKEQKRIKIRLSIIKDVPYSQKIINSNANLFSNPDRKSMKKNKEMQFKNRRVNRDGNLNCGRWQPEEHERFIEAIMKYGNEWKSVQKHVGSRSSTQARSHAQKFFVKMKKANLIDINIDLSKNSIKTLHEIANNMNSEEYLNAVKALNCVAFERKNNTKKRLRTQDSNKNENDNDIDSSAFFTEAPSVINLK
jgi:SHAQKYF class myb-like DNA-binding protein